MTRLAIGSSVILAASSALGQLIAQAPVAAPSFDWSSLSEKAGIVVVLVWMLNWFQKRYDAMLAKSQDFAERALTCLDKSAEIQREVAKSQSEVAKALEDLRASIHNCPIKQ